MDNSLIIDLLIEMAEDIITASDKLDKKLIEKYHNCLDFPEIPWIKEEADLMKELLPSLKSDHPPDMESRNLKNIVLIIKRINPSAKK